MADSLYHPTSPEIAKRRKELAPHTHDAFEAFSQAVFADGALPEKTKQLIAVAVAHVTQCPYCIAATPARAPRRRHRRRDHGSDLGRGRDARRRRLRPLHHRARGTQQVAHLWRDPV